MEIVSQIRCFKATVLYGACTNFSVPCAIVSQLFLLSPCSTHAFHSNSVCVMETDSVRISSSLQCWIKSVIACREEF